MPPYTKTEKTNSGKPFRCLWHRYMEFYKEEGYDVQPCETHKVPQGATYVEAVQMGTRYRYCSEACFAEHRRVRLLDLSLSLAELKEEEEE